MLCRVQQLAELEEVIDYKENEDYPERQAIIRKIWRERLLGCQRSVDTWQRILLVRSLVLSPEDDIDTYLKFASLCR
jgi:FKBP12-rapamycin complex-associated protein